MPALPLDPNNIEDVDTKAEDHVYDEACQICNGKAGRRLPRRPTRGSRIRFKRYGPRCAAARTSRPRVRFSTRTGASPWMTTFKGGHHGNGTGQDRLRGEAAAIRSALSDEDDMASDERNAVPSQQSVKAYVDSKVYAENTIDDCTDTDLASPAGQPEPRSRRGELGEQGREHRRGVASPTTTGERMRTGRFQPWKRGCKLLVVDQCG